MKKRIVFFIGGSYVSGLEIITLHLIKELKQKGHEIYCVISGWNDGVFKGKLEDIDVPFEEVKLGWVYFTKPMWTLNTLLHYPSALITSRKVFKRFKPDVCHFSHYGAVVMLYPILKNNCVFGLHDPELPTRKNNFLFKLVNKKTQFFTGVSKYITNALKGFAIPEEKIRLVYNGIPSKKELIAQRSPGAIISFGIIGQIVPWKGHETLLDSVDLLVKAGVSNFKVLIFGNNKNEYAQKLDGLIASKQLSDYFIWKGFVVDQYKIYEEVDAVVVPSLSQEPCSLSIIESMMFRKAVIVSDRGGNTELVQHESNGLVFPAGDADKLSMYMRQLIEDKVLLNKLAHAAHQKASVDFVVERMGNEYDMIYDETIKRNNC
ncbi:MAG: glycosyltransferase [Chitinophagaceae bacterium]|nr:glycosyltransferase [Chitinophagaceae bacterium]